MHLDLQLSPHIFEKIWNDPIHLMLLSEAWGKMIHEKNQKQKISWHYPFKEKGVVGNNLYISLVLLNLADVIIQNLLWSSNVVFSGRSERRRMGGGGGSNLRKECMPVYHRLLIKDEKRMNLLRHCGLYLSWTVAFKQNCARHVTHIKPFQYCQREYSKQKQRLALDFGDSWSNGMLTLFYTPHG